MGNPSILKNDWPRPDSPELQPPAPTRTLWTMFPLRDPFGKKLTRQGVLYGEKTGMLQLWRNPMNGTLNAYLIAASGYPTIASMGDVQIARMDRGGGMLLYGTHLITTQQGVDTVRQSWWCTVASVRPVNDQAAPPEIIPG